MLAEGPLDKPVTSWTLAALSASELDGWLRSFGQVLGESKINSPVALSERADSPVGYEPIGEGGHHHQRLGRGMVHLTNPEEVA